MAVFPLLARPEEYHPCAADLSADAAARRYWLNLFETHFELQLGAATAAGADDIACNRARRSLRRALAALRERPDRFKPLNLLVLDSVRQQALAVGGIVDEFRLVKDRANTAALAALPRRLAALDHLAGGPLIEALARGLLAGNLFDMGAKASAERFADRDVPFDEALAQLPPRPWLVDDLDRLAAWLLAGRRGGPRRAVIFADNAGPDAVLGVLPFARFLVKADADVILAANDRPSLNDVTVHELRDLLTRVCEIDRAFRSPRLSVVGSGCGAPLIDLGEVSDALADATAGADFVVLIGMGRAIESNWSAAFICPCLRIATLKDPQVAMTLGGSIFDAVLRFDLPSP